MSKFDSLMDYEFRRDEWANREADEQARKRVIEKLAQHWLFSMQCDHTNKTDCATCACGWSSLNHSSVGDAAKEWADHVLRALAKESGEGSR